MKATTTYNNTHNSLQMLLCKIRIHLMCPTTSCLATTSAAIQPNKIITSKVILATDDAVTLTVTLEHATTQ